MIYAHDQRLQRAMRRAGVIEDALRDAAFLPVLDEINGIAVRQLTLRHLLILFNVRSPFFYGGARPPEAVAQFLWTVAPNYNPEGVGRAEFLAKVGAAAEGLKFWRAIERYVDRATMDRPAGKSGGKDSFASMAAVIVDAIASAYHWDDDAILDKPLARIFQYLKLIQLAKNPKAPRHSRFKDRVKSRARDRAQKRLDAAQS